MLNTFEQSECDLSQTDVFCIYGADFAEMFNEYIDWLEKEEERYLILLNDDSEDLTRLMMSDIGRQLIDHPQVRLYPLKSENEEEVFKQIAWEFLFLRFNYFSYPTTDLTKKKKMERVYLKLAFFQSAVHLLASDYSDLGVKVFTNFVKNAALLTSAKNGSQLRGQFRDIPAIVCGAGPSLTKNIDLLRDLQKNALIFAGGSALNVLSHHEIEPHFGTLMDPSIPRSRFLQHNLHELPIFYQSRASNEVLSSHHSSLLWMRGNGSYPIKDWFMSYLKISTPVFDSGWNVANFGASLAYLLGCNPIIFVGVDLCADQNKVYAPGIFDKPDMKDYFPTINKYGEKVLSKRDFVMSGNWLENFAKKYQDRHFINATEGGLGFQGIEDLPLNEVADKYLSQQRSLRGMVYAYTSNIDSFLCDHTELNKGLNLIYTSLKKCSAFCEEILSRLEETFPKLPRENGGVLFLEVELEGELAFKKIIEPLWNIWKHVLIRQKPPDSQWELGKYLNRILFYKRVIDSYLPIVKGTP